MALIPTDWKDSDEILFLYYVDFFHVVSPKQYGDTAVYVYHIYISFGIVSI